METQTIKIWKKTLGNLRMIYALTGNSMVSTLDRLVSAELKRIKERGACGEESIYNREERRLELLRQGLKECSRCEEIKRLEEFSKKKSKKDGLRSSCKECDAAYHQEYRSDPENVKKERLTSSAWKNRNREYVSEYNRKWGEENKEYKRKKKKEWHLANKESENAKARARMKEWVEENPIRHNINCRNYRARKSEAEGYHTEEQIETLFELCNHRCLVCGITEDLAVDHILPLTKGGSNWIDNLQILCKSHNGEKGNHHSQDYRPDHIREWATKELEIT